MTSQQSKAKRVVLVLGMHRSGTSAVTRILNLLGLEIGGNHLPPAADNTLGFWEHPGVMAIHEALLTGLDRRWDDTRALPVGWLDTAFAQRARAELVALIKRDFGGSAFWAIKDPRLCRLVPLWKDILSELGIHSTAVLVVRHPAEVAQSLQVRDGLAPESTWLRWLEYVAESEYATRGMARSLVIYEALLSDWRKELAKVEVDLKVTWPNGPDSVGSVVDGFLNSDERHHCVPVRESDSPEIVRDLYRLCRSYADDVKGWEPISALIDTYRIVAVPFHNDIDQIKALQGQESMITRNTLEQISSRLESLSGTMTGLVSELDMARCEIRNRDELEANLQQRIQALEGSILERNRSIARISSELNFAHGEIHKRDAKINQLTADLSTSQQNAQTLSSEIDALRLQNAALQPLWAKVAWYMRTYGRKALLKRIMLGRAGQPQPQPPQGPDAQAATEPASNPVRDTAQASAVPDATRDPAVPAHAMVAKRFNAIRPLPIFASVGPRARLNLVTDSINSDSLFGGIGTAIILSALLADKRGAGLRVVTREAKADTGGFAQVLACNGIEFSGDVEFEHIDVWDRQARLPICDGDRFLTTSWWTTASVLGSIPGGRVDYLLQEDERMFYPHGDDRLRCSEVLKRRDIRFLVNSELLYQHLLGTGLGHLRENGMWFEPAFPESVFYREPPEKADGRRRLFFYARPHNLRNLFYRGIEVLDKAVTEKLFTPEEWDVDMVGLDVPELTLGGILKPRVLPTMGWKEYGAFVRSVDLGFCLMGTPHPSYPPLDLAASGAVVLTNKFGLKEDLRKYSDNIICSELDVPALLDGLKVALARAQDDPLRQAAFHSNRILHSWPGTLARAVDFLG